MKWMIVLGLAAAVIGRLYRWLFAPAESDKWGLVDVAIAIIGTGGADTPAPPPEDTAAGNAARETPQALRLLARPCAAVFGKSV